MGESDGLGRGLHARRLPASAVNSGGSAGVPQGFAACVVYFAGRDCASCVGSGPAALGSRRSRSRVRRCAECCTVADGVDASTDKAALEVEGWESRGLQRRRLRRGGFGGLDVLAAPGRVDDQLEMQIPPL